MAKTRNRIVITLTACFLLVTGQPFPDSVRAELDTRPQAADDSILQQGLTIYELDKEVERLRLQEARLAEQIAKDEEALQRQGQLLKLRSEAAGDVLRSYYIGQRDRLWMIIFRMNSIHDALYALDTVRFIVANDLRLLRSYRDAFDAEKRLLAELERQQDELVRVIDASLAERDRLLALERELDQKLAVLDAEERVEQEKQIEQVTTAWEEEGLPLFQNVFRALSYAMNDLTDLLQGNDQLSMNGSNLTVRITDDQFNTFLRAKNELFESFQFRFENDGMIVNGTYDNQSALIQGAYELISEPQNLLRFRIAGLHYNGFELPESTRLELEQQFDLSFRPSQLFAGIRATGVTSSEGELRVELAFDGFPLMFGR